MIAKLRGIYAISPNLNPGDQASCELFLDQLSQALQVGLALFQFRSKAALNHDKKDLARRCRELCARYNTPFIVNDDPSLFEHCQADGIHVGQTDDKVFKLRRRLGETAILGVSCHSSIPMAEQAISDGADYVAFGRFFPSLSKPDAPPADLRVLTKAKNQFDVPIVAIGGIRLSNAPLVFAAGADLLAMIDGLFGSSDIQDTMRQLLSLFSNSKPLLHPLHHELID